MTTEVANLPSAEDSDVQSETVSTDATPTYQDMSVGWTVLGSPRPKVPARVKCDGSMALTIDFEPVQYPPDAWEYDSVTVLRKAIKDQLLQTKARLRRAGQRIPQKRRERHARLLELKNCEDESDIEDDLWAMRFWLHEQRLDKTYVLPCHRFLDPNGDVQGPIRTRAFMWRQVMTVRTDAQIRTEQRRAGRPRVPLREQMLDPGRFMRETVHEVVELNHDGTKFGACNPEQ
jgi:hypothetical protein